MPLSAIAGVLDIQVTEEVVSAMLLSMNRRAKGSSAFYIANGKMLLTKIPQPQETAPISVEWAGEKYTICFDGRIYNKRALYKELLLRGFPLESNVDEQVLLFGYICWGEKLLQMVQGEFAMAILCEKEGKVFLARDRMGIKPLFYMQWNSGLLFASEMKTILSYPGVDARLDRNGILQIMLVGPGRIPGSGVFSGILELKPGHYGLYTQGKLQLHRYWRLKDRSHEESFEDTVSKTREMVFEAVRNQISGCQAVGTMLSGGLDSSIISSICAREYDTKGIALNTFSVDYQDHEKYFRPGRFQPNSDTQYIRIMQEALDSHHHWTVLTPEDLVKGLFDAVTARDLPGMADVDSSLLAFAKNIAPYSSVVLSGECADEIFGGYPWYRDQDLRDVNGFPWANSLKERAEFLLQWAKEGICVEEYVRSFYDDSISQADILDDCPSQEKRMKELMHLNIYWFMQTLLERGDRMGSHYGLEIRVPFCDYRIAEYLYAVPWSFKDYKGREKGLLREAMKGVLPESVLYRKKSPFPKTHDPRYLESVSNVAREMLQNQNAPIFQFVNREMFERLLYTDFQWPWYGQLMRRPQTIAYMIQINYWLEHYSVRIV